MTFSLGSTPRSLVKYNDQSLSAITEVGSGAGVTDDMVLIKELTASSDSTLEFVDGASDVVLDNTYPIYVFKFIDIHPSADNVYFTVGFRDGSTAYDATKTTTYFRAYHYEAEATTALEYRAAEDLAQATGFQRLTEGTGGDNDQSCSGTLHLFNPSSTTFVKHFISNISDASHDDANDHTFVAGYCNTTTAIDDIQFKFGTGNFDGTIALYGISKT